MSYWRVREVGIAAGLILAFCNLYPPAVPLQIVAFGLILYVSAKHGVSSGRLVLMGLYMGLGYTIPQVIYLRLPAIMTAILVVELTAMCILLVLLAGRIIGSSGILGAFAAAACITVLDWANYTIIPLWGTAQSFARSWSAYPSLILFESFTGMPGTVFVTAALAGLAAILALRRQARTSAFASIIVVLLMAGMCDWYIFAQQMTAKVPVCAIGWSWTPESTTPDQPAGFEALFAKPIVEAAGKGAKLIVTPEAGLSVGSNTRQQLFDVLAKLAADNGVWLVVGYIDGELDENRLVVFNPDGKAELTYSKTHIIPGMETWNAGTGTVAATRMDGLWLGGMICQDDNFTDISRRHAREGTQVMAVPTLDWAPVSSAHVSNSLHRPIESGYAIVRAAINGVSMIADAHGNVLARMDHIADGPGYIVADVPIYEGGTFYGKAGNWVVWGCMVFVAGYAVMSAARSKSNNKT